MFTDQNVFLSISNYVEFVRYWHKYFLRLHRNNFSKMQVVLEEITLFEKVYKIS